MPYWATAGSTDTLKGRKCNRPQNSVDLFVWRAAWQVVRRYNRFRVLCLLRAWKLGDRPRSQLTLDFHLRFEAVKPGIGRNLTDSQTIA